MTKTLTALLDATYYMWFNENTELDVWLNAPKPEDLVLADLHVLPLSQEQCAWLKAYLTLRDLT